MPFSTSITNYKFPITIEQMSRLSVSAISFLNTAPLMWDFDFGELRRDYRVDYTLPSTCAELLKNGMADIGIIPVAAYTTIPDLVVIPNIAIAARGPVRSILLIGKVPAEQMKRAAVDTSSRTSVALLRVLCEKVYGANPEFIPKEPKLKEMLKDCDAALIIGDSALLAKTEGYHVRDLATDWKEFTRKSFVFAFWAVRKAALEGQDAAKVVRDFQSSRDHGLEPANIARLAKEWSVRLGLSETDVTSYLRDNIYYQLDADCLEGLRLFYQYGAECGALPKAPAVNFI
jgi:chorismate dehydratase